MGNYENIVKIEEMRKKVEEGDFSSAQKILDTIEMKKIKNMSDLNLIAEVYAENERYDEAVELYLKIYDRTKSRRSLYQLINISINNNNAEDAQQYLIQYQKIAPRDFYRYVFRYKIDKMKGESYATLIETLETLRKIEYMEQWAYELAKTYYKAGMEEECIQECSDIVLWFGEGIYVEKAKLLRCYYSGEADKDKIMEELRRRASEDTGKITPADQDSNGSTENSERTENGQTDTRHIVASEEEIYDAANFIKEEETEEFEVGLKKDIQKLLTQEWEEDLDFDEENETVEDVHNNTGNMDVQSDIEDEGLQYHMDKVNGEDLQDNSTEIEEPEPEYNSIPNTEPEPEYNSVPISELEPEYKNTPISQKELEEQEVEETIYRLLQEEDMDEEDRKLSKLAGGLHLDMVEIFGNFLHVISIKKQLVKSLEMILDEHTKTVFLIITGTEGAGKTTLAKDITLFLNKTEKLKTSKIAKIKAEKLNAIDVMSKKETLRDCCLVVENASELKRGTIDSLLELSQCLQGDIAIVFEENKKNMNKLFRESPKLMDLFKNRIHLPQYTQEELIGFAYACLKQQDYNLSPKAQSILQNRIIKIAKQSEPHRHLEQIYNLMQSAMNAADIRTGRQLSNLAAQGKLKNMGVLNVLPEDFTIKP